MPSAAFSVPPSKHRAHPKPDAWPIEALKWFAAQPEGKAVNALYVAFRGMRYVATKVPRKFQQQQQQQE